MQENMACDDYHVDMSSATFGTCMCGRPKAEHRQGVRRIGAPTGGGSSKAAQAWETKCTGYKINLSAANFGECMCGRPKKDHF